MAENGRSTGTVKWFSGQKGFGFIASDAGGDDLFVHQSEIRSEGFRTLREGQRVDFVVDSGEDGRTKAVDVVGLAGSFRSGGSRGSAAVRGGYGGGGVRGGGRRGFRGRGGYGRSDGGGFGGGGYGRGGRSGGDYGGGRGGGGRGGVECYNCGGIGHLARECVGGGGGDGGDRGYNGDGGGMRGYRSGRGGGGRGGGGRACYNCGEEGHFARDCPVDQN